MKITDVYPEYVFQRLGAGKNVVAVDFKKGLFLSLESESITQLQWLISQCDPKDITKNYIRFYQIEGDL